MFVTVYGLDVKVESGKVVKVYDGKKTVYPYKMVDDGVFMKWEPWESPSFSTFKKYLYSGKAMVGPSVVWEPWRTVKSTRRGRFLYH